MRLLFLAMALFLATPLGEWIVREFLICDGDYVDGSPPNSCGTLDLTTVTTSAGAKAYGLPRYVVADIRTDNCTSGTGNTGFLIGLVASGGERHQLHALPMELGTNVSSVTIDPLSHRFISFDVTAEGSGTCTDFEVLLRMYYTRAALFGQT
jgi:hypothetical protein